MVGFSRRLAERGYAVYNIDYRLASPGQPRPACAEDCLAAARFLLNGGVRAYGLQPQSIWIMGASAGGHLALWTGFHLPREQMRGVISVSGIVAPHNVFARGYGPDQARYQVGGNWDRQVDDWEGWHVFGVLWDETGYTFYVDGKEDGRVEDLVSHRPHFLLLTTECRFFRKNRMTGKASPDLAAAVAARDQFEVDYVRVWDEVKEKGNE